LAQQILFFGVEFSVEKRSSNHFLVDILGTLGFLPRFWAFLDGQSSTTRKKIKSRAPHSVLAAGELKEMEFSFEFPRLSMYRKMVLRKIPVL
jgi:hypothetical protein